MALTYRAVTRNSMLAFRRLIAGQVSQADDAELAARVKASFAYGAPQGTGTDRQYAAILGDTDRYRLLAGLMVQVSESCSFVSTRGSAV